MTHILHLNDNNIVVQSAAEHAHSQGYAWLKGDSVVFDSDPQNSPVRHCRLAPQEINSRYWQRCELSSLPSNEAGVRHSGDLIWKHLSDLKARHKLAKVVLVVPSHYQSANLQLLLGIAKTCGLQVNGLVNKAVLALSTAEVQAGDYLHVDVQLHQTVASSVEIKGGTAKLGAVEIIQGVGVHAMHDALLRAMQTHFIQNDRFDPLHYAETEQQLFDQLSESASQIRRLGKASVSVHHQNQQHSTSLDKKAWVTSLEHLLAPLEAAASAVDHSYVDMNSAFGASQAEGINEHLFTLIEGVPAFEAIRLPPAPADDSGLTYLTELSLKSGREPAAIKDQSGESSSSRAPAAPTGATHLMQAGIAVPIEHSEVTTDNNNLVLGACPRGNAEDLLAAGKLFIMNDESRTTLKPNDRLGSHLAEGVITVVQVV